MAPDANACKRYLALYAAAVALISLPFAVNYLFLLRANEASSYAAIVERQLARGALYGSALNGNDLKYKVELIRGVRPEVVLIGSSRAMQVRDLVFTRPFVNAGGVSSNLLESETFVAQMLEAHVPKLVLYFVDYWWFNSRWEQASNRYLIDETALSFAKLTSPFQWMRDGRISWDLYRDMLLEGRHENAYTRFETLGVFATTHSLGYRTDGSFFNSRGLKRDEGVIAYYWDELKSIEKGRSERVNLGLGDFVDEGNLRRYLRILERLEQRGVTVVVVMPPIAPRYLKAIRAHSQEAFVTPLAARLSKEVPSLYDFTEFPVPGNADCEYADGYHPGDTLSLRLMKAILERTPDSPLKPYLDLPKLDQYLARYAGHAFILEPPSMYKAREFDFLGLGCRKESLA
jgi:hypothetical protein